MKLFTMFGVARQNKKMNLGGIGLGLVISKLII
jgi:signal transduction histidine kinase